MSHIGVLWPSHLGPVNFHLHDTSYLYDVWLSIFYSKIKVFVYYFLSDIRSYVWMRVDFLTVHSRRGILSETLYYFLTPVMLQEIFYCLSEILQQLPDG